MWRFWPDAVGTWDGTWDQEKWVEEMFINAEALLAVEIESRDEGLT